MRIHYKLKSKSKGYFFLMLLMLMPFLMVAQGVTTGNISGVILDDGGKPVSDAYISAIHEPSGSKYFTASQANGQFVIQGVRIGGPYTIITTHLGHDSDTLRDAQVALGADLELQILMYVASKKLEGVTITTRKNAIMNSGKAGSGLNIDKNTMASMPTISRGMGDFTRMVPQAGAQGLLGKGGKSNNVSVDGAAFNNSFGLGNEGSGVPGANAGAQPISLDAIEQISVNVSPYDVKQGGFTGAGVNAVTRSGDNELRGSVYYFFRNQNMVGNKVREATIARTSLTENTVGFRIGGPIIKNKLFFFANYEYIKNVQPGAAYVAGRQGLSGGNVSNIQASSLDALSNFLQNTYQYNPGNYELYNVPVQSNKFLVKLDWNINDKNKFYIRYNQLNAVSTFPSVSNINAIGFSNNGYTRNNEVYSLTAELNSRLSEKVSNRLFSSYNSLPDYRQYLGTLFPLVNIMDNGNTYRFGVDPAARDNRVGQKTFQLQDDITYLVGKHKISTGLSWQYINVSNQFTFNPQGTFTFSSLADFYNSAPAGTSTPIGPSTGLGTPAQYQLNYTVQPGRSVTLANPTFSQLGIYVQDEFSATSRLKITAGIRADAVTFLKKPEDNAAVAAMTFQGAEGAPEQYRTSQIPGTKITVSPRLGFNWNVDGERKFQIRGGTGIFSGLIPFVYIEKQYSINGLNEGNINAANPAAAENYPFNPNPDAYKPSNGATLKTYEVDLVTSKFRMPQTWRSTLGFDYKLPLDIVASLEFLYSQDINAPFYRNANLDYNTATTADDGRFRYTNARINKDITGAYVLDNINMGHQFFTTVSLNKQFASGISASLAYTYGQSKDAYSFRSTTPSGAFNSIQVVGNPNKPVLAYSDFDLRHRVVGTASYRFEYANKKLATTIGLFLEAAQQGRGSYVYGGTGNVNNDQIAGNDLIYVPANASEINLVAYTQNGTTVTPQQQWDALNTFISNSPYLSSRRGQFAERNGVILPFYFQTDLKLAEDFTIRLGKKETTHKFQLTADILNFTNLLNKNWGTLQSIANPAPIEAVTANTFRVNPDNLKRGEFVQDNGLSALINPNASSRWRMMIGIRYTFN